MRRKVKILSRYKFYLAFENTAIRDYVSEKVETAWIHSFVLFDNAHVQVFEGLIAGTVPIYRGTITIDKFLPVGSYINANGMSAADLANLVQAVANDESLYNSYFEFKKKGIPNHFRDIAEMSYTHPNALCRICDYYINATSKV